MVIVQLIALFYKNRHAESIRKLVATWLDSTSSTTDDDDDEHNTSPSVRSFT